MFSFFFANWVLIKEGDKVHKSRNLRRSGTDASRIKLITYAGHEIKRRVKANLNYGF